MGDIFNGFLNFMGWILAAFYAVIPSAGIAIILLTVLVRLVLFPLTAKQAKSMLAMQRAQPEIKKLQQKYKNDRQKLNEELMKFYKENQINPFGGCLPLLLQMPVFIALFRLLRNIPAHLPQTSGALGNFYRAICPTDCPKGYDYKLPFFQNGWKLDLSLSAGGAHNGFLSATPYFILVALVVVTAYVQQRQTMRYQTQANAQMQVIGKVMPLMFAFISINLPAGVVLYFFVSNLWQIGQQEFVYRRIGTPTGEPHGKRGKGAIDAKSTEAPASGGGLRGLLAGGKPAADDDAGTNGTSAKDAGGAEQQPSDGPKAKSAGDGSGGNAKGSSASGEARRRNNRKRKR